MLITRIVKKGKSDVTIHFDNDALLFLAVEVFLKSGLKKGNDISDDRFSFLIEQNKLSTYLFSKGFEYDLIKEVSNRLIKDKNEEY